MKIGFFDTRKLSTFELARLRLTGWYLLIIMALSVLFSLAIFQLQAADLHRRFGQFEFRIGRTEILAPRQPLSSNQLIEESLDNLRWQLININLGILLVSAGASYFLAGLTLRPIKRAMDEQTRFIADASHEIRTPLTAMKTSTEVALRSRRLDPKEIRQLLQDNLAKISLLEGLSTALLEILRDGEVEQNRTTRVNLGEVVTEAVRRFKPQVLAKKIKLSVDTADINILGNRDELTRLVTILIDNSIKYTPDHGRVNISTGRVDGAVEIAVSDTGIGIAPSDLSHIFDRFYRADRSRSAPGFGLGLPIAQKIVRDHAGSIELHSTPGRGTEVRIKLPIASHLS